MEFNNYNPPLLSSLYWHVYCRWVQLELNEDSPDSDYDLIEEYELFLSQIGPYTNGLALEHFKDTPVVVNFPALKLVPKK